jgi:uncharacterized protein YqeY
MALKERLMEDLKEALRGKDVQRKDTIRMVRAAVRNAEIDAQRDATDDEILDIISREVKRRNEAIDWFRKAGRLELVAVEQEQLDVLTGYLPRQLSREEIEEAVHCVVTEMGATGMKQLGPVMREAMARLRGKADGRLVNEIAREILGD